MDKFGHDELYICGEEEKKKKVLIGTFTLFCWLLFWVVCCLNKVKL